MTHQYMTNPYGLPVPSPGPNYVPGKAFENAPVDIISRDKNLIFLVEGHVFSKDVFHMLKEDRDWDALVRGDARILGRVLLDANFLDLVTTRDGYLRASSIREQEINALAPKVRHFLRKQMEEAPTIRTLDFAHSPFTNTQH